MSKDERRSKTSRYFCPSVLSARFGGKPEALQTGVELRAGDPEERRRVRLIAFRLIQCGEDGALLQVGQPLWSGFLGWPVAGCFLTNAPRAGQVEMGRREEAPVGKDEGPLHGVRKLPDVAGPPVGLQQLLRVAAQARLALAEFRAEHFDEVLGQKKDVVASLAEGGAGGR